MKVLLLDNYDSFTYNLVQLVRQCMPSVDLEVHLNDQLSVADAHRFDKFIFSPGPGLPSEAGILSTLIRTYAETKPMLGVCLGHQAIGEVFGGKLVNLPNVFHGIASPINIIEADYLFEGISNPFEGGRYHSWVVQAESLPQELEALAFDSENTLMAIRHRKYDIRGVQFHPESMMTPSGLTLIRNFLLH